MGYEKERSDASNEAGNELRAEGCEKIDGKLSIWIVGRASIAKRREGKSRRGN